ncbi:chemotaxis protein CheW [Andreprevotia chitinilytica]|uniref:chemotaxis protein CheW n=1 Tax=Andreprevotia chitinilytica TaxID=396808 RepID=UPI0005547206|nr:chemotaxis protein CheW [Andreprevotia chitinilytica]
MPAVDQSLLVFLLEQQRYALSLPVVERVLHALAVTPLPGAPAAVQGVVNVHGQVASVFDIRSRFGLQTRPPRLGDQLILARAALRLVALGVDAVEGVVDFPDSAIADPTEVLLHNSAFIKGVVRLPDGLLLIHDLDAFLAPDEAQALDAALARFE